MKLTENQIIALVDLSDGDLKYGISIRGRRALPSLRKRGLVSQLYGDDRRADQWQIRPEGITAVRQLAIMWHLRRRV